MRSVFLLSFILNLVCFGLSAYSVSPVVVKFEPREKMKKVTVFNDEKHPILIQIRVQNWTREGGEDVLSKTQKVVASPPFVTVAPGTSQIIRVVRQSKKPLLAEETYRLLISQIPGPESKLNKKSTAAFVSTFSLPVIFLHPKSKPVLVWAAERIGERLVIHLSNIGEGQIAVKQLVADIGSKKNLKLSPYKYSRVLSGVTEKWVSEPIKKGFAVGSKVSIEAIVEDGETINAQAEIKPPVKRLFFKALVFKDKIQVRVSQEGGLDLKVKSLKIKDSKGGWHSLKFENKNENLISNLENWTMAPSKNFKIGDTIKIDGTSAQGPIGGEAVLQEPN